jgi:protein phosphatase PTC1
MFGSSSSKDGVGSSSVGSSTGSAATSSAVLEGGVSSAGEPTETSESTSALTNASSNEEENGPTDEKKNRSSGVTKASSFLSNAKNSFHLHGPSSSSPTKDSHAPQSPLQKLGKSDPALSVPQGANNNSAGESHPGPRSTFHVGVTEDKNKKCRRTMEDTHSYLYNFLSTPAPALDSLTKSASRSSVETPLPPTGSNISGASKADLTETDNGYFAIFDGHAGTFAADWCGKKLHIILEEAIRKQPNTPIPELLDQSFTSADQQLEKLPLKNSGCTAVTAVLRWEDRIPNAQSATGSSGLAPATVVAVQSINAAHRSGEGVENSAESTGRKTSTSHNKIEAGAAAIAPPLTTTASTAQVKLMDAASRQRVLYTANVGDARIVLCRNGKALRLSYDHKGSDENEGRRISNAGGLILNNRVNGVLAVTRALGDAYMKDLVTGHPYTTETVVQPEVDEFLILACDGVSFSHLGLSTC